MTQITRLSRRQLLAATAGAVGAAIAGCISDDRENESGASDDPDDNATGEPGDPTASVTVAIHADPYFQFDPNLVHLEPGGTVRWKVTDGFRHTVTAYHPDTHRHQRIPENAEPWQSGLLREGMTFEQSFEAEGIYDYVDTRSLCSSHEALGGVGRVIVGWPDIETEPAYQHDISRLPSRAETVMRDINERSYELLAQ